MTYLEEERVGLLSLHEVIDTTTTSGKLACRPTTSVEPLFHSARRLKGTLLSSLHFRTKLSATGLKWQRTTPPLRGAPRLRGPALHFRPIHI